MKRQLTSILLFSALLVGGASTFVSCTDHESDSNYNTSVSLADAIKNQVDELGKINTWLGDLKTSNPDLAAAIDARVKDNWKAMIGDNGAVSELAQYATLDQAIRASKAYTGMKDTLDAHTRQIAALENLRKSDSLFFAKADSALQEITTIANGGLKVTNKNQIDIDTDVIFVFNCGSSNTLVD